MKHIIKEGFAPKLTTYRSTCTRCGTYFEYDELDVFAPVGNGYGSVSCPLEKCNGIVAVKPSDIVIE